MQRLRISGAVPLLSLYAFMAGREKNYLFNLHFYINWSLDTGRIPSQVILNNYTRLIHLLVRRFVLVAAGQTPYGSNFSCDTPYLDSHFCVFYRSS
jgi:hypothetical protein